MHLFEAPHRVQDVGAPALADQRLAVRGELALEIGVGHRVLALALGIEHARGKLLAAREADFHRTRAAAGIEAFALRVEPRIRDLYHALHLRTGEALGQELVRPYFSVHQGERRAHRRAHLRIENVVAVLVVVAVHAYRVEADAQRLDVPRTDPMLVPQGDDAVDRRVVVPAARVGLEIDACDLPALAELLQQPFPLEFSARVGVGKTVAAFQHFARAGNPPLREFRAQQPVAR